MDHSRRNDPSFSRHFRDAAVDPCDPYVLFKTEMAIIKKHPHYKPDNAADPCKPGTCHNLVGLALSGGGIRSATFNLGLMQAMARDGLMGRIHYLSTVSGGGYIGSCLSTLLSSEGVACDEVLREEKFPFARSRGQTASASPSAAAVDAGNAATSAPLTRKPGEDGGAGCEKEPVRHLRYYSNYITAEGNFIQKYVRPALVLLRSMLLNFLTVAPYLILLAVLLSSFFLLRSNFQLDSRSTRWFLFDLHRFENALHEVERVERARWSLVTERTPYLGPVDFSTRAKYLAEHQDEAYLDLTGRLEAAGEELRHAWRPVWAGPLVLLGLAMAAAILTLPFACGNLKARFSNSCALGWILLVSGALLLLNLYGTAIAYYHHLRLSPEWGFFGLLTLLAPKLLQVISGEVEKEKKKPWVKIAGAIVLLALVPLALLFLTGIGIGMLTGAADFFSACAAALAIALAAFTLCVLFIDVNRISLHSFYRDRLSRAYLIEDSSEKGEDIFTKVRPRDKLELSALPDRPYHLLNANLNLSKRMPDIDKGETTSEATFRSGESFILSKCWCGSEATGYRQTRRYENKECHLDLGTAMAISGGAANVGTGLIRLPLLRLLMGLLNVRLGYWAPHPEGDFQGPVSAPGWFHPIENFKKSWWSMYEWFFGYRPRAGYISLSDGGHFENLGVYELLRRRCRYIIVGDAEADPRMSFGALSNLIRLARIDFGIVIDIDLGDILPAPRTGLSLSHCALGNIHYPAGDGLGPEKGYLLYLKSSLTGDEPQHLREYKVHNPAYPHEPTSDQWFDERQFEVYRELGYHVGKRALGPCSALNPDCFPEDSFKVLERFWQPHSAAALENLSARV